MRNMMRSIMRSNNLQRRAQEKLAGEIAKHGAKLTRRNLHIDAFTIRSLTRMGRRPSLFNVFVCLRAPRRQVQPNAIWDLLSAAVARASKGESAPQILPRPPGQS